MNTICTDRLPCLRSHCDALAAAIAQRLRRRRPRSRCRVAPTARRGSPRRGSFVAVAWGAAANGKGDIFLAVSRDGGHTFSTPVRVNAVEGDARISGEIAPRVALRPASSGSDPRDHRDVECEGRHDADPDGALARRRPHVRRRDESADQGRDRRSRLAGVGARCARRAAHDLARSSRDGRGQGGGRSFRAQGRARRRRHGAEVGALLRRRRRARARAVQGRLLLLQDRDGDRDRRARSTRPGATCSPATCATWASRCRATAARPSRRSTRVNQDGWSIQGCPDDGPAMAVDAKGTVHLVWPTVQERAGRDPLRDVAERRRVLDAGARADAGRAEAVASADRRRRPRPRVRRVGRGPRRRRGARRSRRSADRTPPDDPRRSRRRIR